MKPTAFEAADLTLLPALQPPGWNDIGNAFRFYLDAPFCRPVKITDDGVLAALGASIRLPSRGWIGHVIVHESFRRRGFGSAIVSALIDHLRDRPTISLVSTDEGRALYTHFGFQPVETYSLLEAPDLCSEPASSGAIRSALESDWDALVHLDCIVSGEERGDLLRPHLSDALVVAGDGALRGAYLPRLGSGLCIAADDEAGLALLGVHISRSRRAALPQSNETGLRYLAEHGFVEYRKATRMALGAAYPWRPRGIFNRIGGNLG